MTDTGYSLDHPSVVASLEAMALADKSWGGQRDECYAWKKVKENLDLNAASNVNQRNISYAQPNRTRSRPYFVISMQGPWPADEGYRSVHAPSTLDEALSEPTHPLLIKAIRTRDELRKSLVAKYGEPASYGKTGISAEIRRVLQTTDEGRRRLEKFPTCVVTISVFAKTAEAYDREEWSPLNTRDIHTIFRAQPDRAALVQRRVWSQAAAQAEVKRRNAAKPGGGTGRTASFDTAKLARRGRAVATSALRKANDKPSEEELEAARDMYFSVSALLDKWGELEIAQADYYAQSDKNAYKLKAVA